MPKYLKYFLFIPIYLCCNFTYGQIKIGENPQILDASSLLELESSSKVLVISRVSNAEMQLLQPLRGGLVFNTDENCVFFYNGTDWSSLCSTGGSNSNEIISLTENGNGTYTFLGTDQVPITFNGAEDTLSTLVNNQDGTFTYTNENGDGTVLTLNGGSLEDNEDGSYTFTNGDGTTVNINGLTETTTTLIDNEDGTYTYTNEIGGETFINTNSADEEFSGTTGSVVFSGDDGTLNENNTSIYWDNTNARLGLHTTTPNSTVTVNGSFATAIRFTGGDVGLNEADHTVLINGSGYSTLYMPSANGANGRMYIIKKNPSVNLSVAGGYRDTNNVNRSDVPVNVLWLQSNGFNWEQVN
tara:strand:- start:523 stop:1590 length:1068 start_codon:yes stop_codon:yes gene_type:complete